jgi:hypothetical protein
MHSANPAIPALRQRFCSDGHEPPFAGSTVGCAGRVGSRFWHPVIPPRRSKATQIERALIRETPFANLYGNVSMAIPR